MFPEHTPSFLFSTLEVMALVFVFIIGLAALAIVILFISDVTQTSQAIRRNFPVIGHFRFLFEHLGVFFRQYFFAMDREELPFNRAERTWVYRAAKNASSTVPFGSTRDLRPVGTVYFVNCPFPTLDSDHLPSPPLTIGEDCPHPYHAPSFFNISGMSYGAISKPAVLALSNGARMANCWMNTGEGGLSPYHLQGGADIVFQIGTAKYGVRNNKGELDDNKLEAIAAHEQVRMFEIKLSQGAKPGKGGILPGVKVTSEIARIRGIPEGKDSISPNRHTDINSVADILDMVRRVRSVTGKPVGFKAVIGAYDWLDKLLEEVNRRGHDSAPDFITVDGAEGGTGAAPMSLIDNMGIPLREALPLVIDKLNTHRLRDRIKVIASGKLITPVEVAWAFCVGTDFIASARGFMFSLGCIQALQCNRDTCPTGIATHNPRLQKGLVPSNKAERVRHYAGNMRHGVSIIAHSCGVTEPRQLKRYHARMVTGSGRSLPLNEVFPDTVPVKT
ncbi:MAG: FMN-binding glutamate synthase family protein [Gammaproteobacteria bacterium]|nr:MAG: FMN-binding glutamate synthase family protein [Gammaproteobacteria bacterium]